jgi:hypothetical protein
MARGRSDAEWLGALKIGVTLTMWVWVRVAVLVVGFFIFLLGPSSSSDVLSIGWYELSAFFILPIFGLLFVVGLQAVNSRSAPVWDIPSWQANPFQLSQPLLFFHFGGYFALSVGIGMILKTLIKGWAIQPGTFMWVVFGIGLLAGVQLCVMVFRRKIKTGEHA